MAAERSDLDARGSSSEPNLTTAGDKLWQSGFPPGITVDELQRYRRRRTPHTATTTDSLKLEDGSFKDIKSEYKRSFIDYYKLLGGSYDELHFRKEDISPVRSAHHEDNLKLEDNHEPHQSEYHDAYVEYPVEEFMKRTTYNLLESDGMTDAKENIDPSNVPDSKLSETFPRRKRKAHPYRRPTTLRLEGDFFALTENAEKFIRYLLEKRPELARRSTTLKLEGDMDIQTEMREKFVPLDYHQRPPLCKKSTNLHLEGDLSIMTEKQDMFRSFEPSKRPPLSRHTSNLHLEGDLELVPEYRKEFIEYKDIQRAKPALPVNNLKTDGFYEVKSGVSKAFEQQMHPQIPFLRGGIDDFGVRPGGSGRSTPRLMISKLDSHLDQEESSDNKTDNIESDSVQRHKGRGYRRADNLSLGGRIDMNPEYRNAYIDFYKDGRSSPIQTRSRRVIQDNHLKSEGEMEISPEYMSSYVDFPRERPIVRRPECSLSSEGEWDHLTEKREKYISYQNVPRTETLKREPELKLEGRFECQPEYRKAYKDYLIRERIERKPRPIDQLSRKGFELVSSDDQKIEREKSGVTSSTRRRDLVPVQVSPQSRSNRLNLKPPLSQKPSKPSSSSTSSVPSSPKPSRQRDKSVARSPRFNSLSKIETSVFGPKLTVPSPTYGSRSNSRSPSPVPSRTVEHIPRSRNVSPVPNRRSDVRISEAQRRRQIKSYNSPVRVENLAYKSPVSPVPPVIASSGRKKWLNEDSVDDDPAFVVLDKEINNNNQQDAYVRKNIARENKWMPSWYSPP